MDRTDIAVRRVTKHTGAEILNVDLAVPQSPEVYARIRKALVDHGVIYFRNQNIDSDQNMHFARQFG
jgi:taurine dioxygenase